MRRGFYARPTLEVARDLLGLVLVHDTTEGLTSGVIVEVEAYIGEDDPACHAAAGLTARTAPMYGSPGYAYVYLNYGIHHLFNVVTEPAGRPAAVLVRALKPLDGVALMRDRRRMAAVKDVSDGALCRGPGNLTRALGIGPGHNRADLVRGTQGVWIEDRGLQVMDVTWGPRIGISVGLDRPWRAVAASVVPRPGSEQLGRISLRRRRALLLRR